MKKLPLPGHSARSTFDTCVSGISEFTLRSRFDAVVSDFESWANYYDVQATMANLFSIQPFTADGTNIVFGTITKNELSKLYTYYMVKKSSARYIYDHILISANDKCPYCGGIGRPRTLDHYLPKSKYPQFSVVPNNLLPCCRDCNSGNKQTSIATSEEEQVLHPYFDHDKFFNQQWINARVHPGNPCCLEYYVNPPCSWSHTDKARVLKHFNDFGLDARYSIQAGEELSILIDQRKGHMEKFTNNQFSQYLSSIGSSSSLFVNHWKKIMYQTLAADSWFCNENF
ncbi:MAG: HNH endonuclease [Gammaproteobacteria bacterium]